MRIVLFSTYELGRQSFGVASAAAWLRDAGAEVEVHDLSLCAFDESMVVGADVVGCFIPMHTATRLAEPVIRRSRIAAPQAHIVAFGLYAPMNAPFLTEAGVDSVVGGEFEERLVEILDAVRSGSRPSPAPEGTIRQRFVVPDRAGLPDLGRYARFQPVDGPSRVTGSTEATRGCRHLCRHCPIVPVYGGRFVVVEPDVVLADIRAQVAAGATHITFGDPDFFNGPAHAMRIARRLHDEFPDVTYDVTIKVEHLVRHLDLLPELRATGCALVTTAVESFDPEILERFDKRHGPDDFERALTAMRAIDLPINPTFVAFTPWTTVAGYRAFLGEIARLGLIGNVSPIQYAIRLLVPAGSLLLDLPEVADLVGPFDDRALVHPWVHPDPMVDRLQASIMKIAGDAGDASRAEVFQRVWRAVDAVVGVPATAPDVEAVPVATVPYLTEPWYC